MARKKKGKGATPFFGNTIKGLPKNVVRRYNKKGVKYYVTSEGKRTTADIWKAVKVAVREKKAIPKKRKPAKLIELPAELHRAFLSLLKDYLFNKNYLVEITDLGKRYFKNGSYDLFNSMRALYNDAIKLSREENADEIEESNDLIYFPYLDFVNKIISFRADEIKEYNHNSGRETPLNSDYIRKFF